MPEVHLKFSKEWYALAEKVLSAVNMMRIQQKLPAMSMESWLKSVITTGMSQIIAEYESGFQNLQPQPEEKQTKGEK